MAAPTTLNEFDTKRNADNLRCLAALARLLAESPQSRVGQLVYTANLLSGQLSLFYTEPGLLADALEEMINTQQGYRK